MGREGEALPGPASVSALILSGPDDSIFDDIFDWIANAIGSIVRSVTNEIAKAWAGIVSHITDWITWLWGNISSWFTDLWTRITSARDAVAGWISAEIWNLWGWITSAMDAVVGWISTSIWELWGWVSAKIWELWGWISASISGLWGAISSWFTDLWVRLDSWFTWLADSIQGQVAAVLSTWWATFLDRLLDVGSWIGAVLDGIAAWFLADEPGHSPRWTAVFESIGKWFSDWFFKFPMWMIDHFEEKIAYGLTESLKWVGKIFGEVFETFMDAVMGLVRQIGPTNPSTATDSYSAMARVGLVALGGLAGMTIAGETLNPLSHLGLGHISAMIYDMTNFKLITGVFMGALTFAMLKQPLTYHFNEIFRPYVLSPRDFMELMSRDAFRHPGLLQEPDLARSVQELTGGEGNAWESRMIGYYGYPAQYHGLFRELSHARLGYFALAGIARTGFWDEAWFIEALARTGYSVTAREALLRMYQEQVKYARQQPVMYHLRRLAREGYYTIGRVKEVLAEVNAMVSLDDIRIVAIGLEQEYETYDMALDISLRAFSRGIISEAECRKNLADLNIPSPLIDVQLTREKLGIIRRITWAAPETVPAMQYVEE